VHKTANILDKMPKSVQGRAKALIHEMYLSPTRKSALAAYDQFIVSYQAKYPKRLSAWRKNRPCYGSAPHPENQGMLLRDTNRPAEAEPLYRRALAIDERSFGPDHPTVATALNNLAGLLSGDTNRLAEAEPLYRQALTIRERVSVRSILTWQQASTTWPCCSAPPTGWLRPSRFTAGR
jgi:tetratricopeptide (TPR) repeat protein